MPLKLPAVRTSSATMGQWDVGILTASPNSTAREPAWECTAVSAEVQTISYRNLVTSLSSQTAVLSSLTSRTVGSLKSTVRWSRLPSCWLEMTSPDRDKLETMATWMPDLGVRMSALRATNWSLARQKVLWLFTIICETAVKTRTASEWRELSEFVQTFPLVSAKDVRSPE